MAFDIVIHSGTTQSFKSGATREIKKDKGRFDLISPLALQRLARHYENGAKVYGDRNWEKGIPYHSLLDSAERHLNTIKQLLLTGQPWDEDHAAAVCWNVFALMHFMEMGRDDLDDVSPYLGSDKVTITQADLDRIKNTNDFSDAFL